MNNTIYNLGKTVRIATDPALSAAYAANATATVTTAGTASVKEVQTITPILDAQSVYKLTLGAVVLTTAAVDATPTVAELVTLIQGATGYDTAGFTVAASGSNIVLTFDANGVQTDIAVLTYREYIEGPVTAAGAPAYHPVVRVVSTVPVCVRFGATIDTEAIDTDPLVPANTVEYFSVSEGQYISVKRQGNTDGYTYLTYMTK